MKMSSCVPLNASSPVGACYGSRPMILVTEDERRVRSFVVRGLSQEGFTVREAADGLEAGQLLANERFNLLLLDWVLPHKSGLEGLARAARPQRHDPGDRAHRRRRRRRSRPLDPAPMTTW